MRRFAFFSSVIVTVSTLAGAQTQPSLEGSWLLDKTRSHYPAQSATEVIHQHGPAVDISFRETSPGRPDIAFDLHLTTDAKPTTNTVGANKFTSTTHWDGNRLVTFVEGDRGQHMTETRELSADGSVLTVTGYHQDELTKPYYVRVMVKTDAPGSKK